MGIGTWFGKSTKKDHGMVIHFFDDNSFDFEVKPLDRSFFVDKKDKEIVAGWKDSYGLRKWFPGYGGVTKGPVTPIYNRDIIWDPFEQVADKDKPMKGALLSNSYFSKLAENTLNDIHTHNRQLSSLDRLILILGVALGVELIVFLIVFLRSRA